MTRPLRIDVAGGWYHITSRGQRRQLIYCDGRDRREFIARLAEASRRYRVEVHAYVLMPNHYHLLLRTPKANASAAMQWLNNGYGMWWNRRHGQVGHVFQGRFKSILVEEGTWSLSLSLYLHFNPVAVQRLGLGKRDKKAEALGLRGAAAETVKARLETLRTYRWSSYRAYAGYEASPDWLKTEDVLARIEGGQAGYRRMAEARLRQGQVEAVWSNLKWNVVLGSELFAERMRRRAEVVRETEGRRDLRSEVTWEELVAAVENVRGEGWEAFAGRHGDWGRDLVLWLARRHAGMTLKELGEKAGGMDYSAVSEAVRRFDRTRRPLKEVRDALARVGQILNMET
jgi:REP element-mobilizing transposase RayT